jgi:membrane protease YdiL (CAAX protease family)
MQKISAAVRAIVIVLGIAAIAGLANRLIADSGLQTWFLMRQQSLPGALLMASAVQNMAYGLVALFAALLVACGYWRSLLPSQINKLHLLLCLGIGILFAMFFNHPMHMLLFETWFGKPNFTGGAVSDTIAAGIFSGLQGYGRLLSFSALATIVLSPLVEELTDRGILFKEAESLPIWITAALSFLVFCFSHYAIGGMAKVLAVAPAALLFISVRLKTSSFVYAAAAHMGMNLAALLKLQVF